MLPPSIPKKDSQKNANTQLLNLEVHAIKLDKASVKQKNENASSSTMIANIQGLNQHFKKSSSNIQDNNSKEAIQEYHTQFKSKTPQERENKLAIKYSKMPTHFELHSQETSPALMPQIHQTNFQQYSINLNQVPQNMKPNSQKTLILGGFQVNQNEKNYGKLKQQSANSTARNQTKIFYNNQQTSLKNLNGNIKKPSSSQSSSQQQLQIQYSLHVSLDQNEVNQFNFNNEQNGQNDENGQLNGFVIGGQKLICTKQIVNSTKDGLRQRKKSNHLIKQIANNQYSIESQNKLESLNSQINNNISQSNKHLLPKLYINEQTAQFNSIYNYQNSSINGQQKIFKQSNSFSQLDNQANKRLQQSPSQVQNDKLQIQALNQQSNQYLFPLQNEQRQYAIPNALNIGTLNKSLNRISQNQSNSLNNTQKIQGNLNQYEQQQNIGSKLHFSPKTNNGSFRNLPQKQANLEDKDQDQIKSDSIQENRMLSNQKQSQNTYSSDQVMQFSSSSKNFNKQLTQLQRNSDYINIQDDKSINTNIQAQDDNLQKNNQPNIIISDKYTIKLKQEQKEDQNQSNIRKRKDSEPKCAMTTSGSSVQAKQQNNESFNQAYKGNKQQNEEQGKFQQQKRPFFFQQKQNELQSKLQSPTINNQIQINLKNKQNIIQKSSKKILAHPNSITIQEQKEIKPKMKQEPLTIQQFELNEEFFRESFDGYNFDAEQSLSGTWTGYTIQQYMKNQKEEIEKSRKGSAQKEKKKKNSLLSAKQTEKNGIDSKSTAQNQKQAPADQVKEIKQDQKQNQDKKMKEENQNNQEIEEDIQVSEN